jgi:cation diffusion facilitator CzcD-associated flavoprotein CzcO
MPTEHHDVVLVGAGLSGIGAAVHLHRKCPGKRDVIPEGRPSMGGTSDLFRYPGIRSDSDMHTLGYNFKPWRDAKAIADGTAILGYVKETAAENDVDRHIRYGLRATKASWSTDDAAWTVEAERAETGETVRFTCNFLLMCAGYYSYKAGHSPEFEGQEHFRGTIIHPSSGPGPRLPRQKVVVIGCRATAMTLVPAMAKDVGHVVFCSGRRPTSCHAPTRTSSRTRCAGSLRALGLRDHALEERRAPAVPLQPDAHAPRAGQGEASRHGPQRSSDRTTTSRRTSRRGTTLGPAPLSRAEQRPVRGDPMAGVGRHRSDRTLHGDRCRAAPAST